MKYLVLLFSFFALIFGAQSLSAQKKQITIKDCNIKWEGHKLVGGHEGTIQLKKGILVVKKNQIKGGKFIVDMSSIKTTDMSEEYNLKLDSHLKNQDFFNVTKYPTSTLIFKKILNKGNGNYIITANLTIKGITKSVQFPLVVKNKTATANISINRTNYDIKYGSASFFDDIGDKAIKDNFDLIITFTF